jgi:hypothetical protein
VQNCILCRLSGGNCVFHLTAQPSQDLLSNLTRWAVEVLQVGRLNQMVTVFHKHSSKWEPLPFVKNALKFGLGFHVHDPKDEPGAAEIELTGPSAVCDISSTDYDAVDDETPAACVITASRKVALADANVFDAMPAVGFVVKKLHKHKVLVQFSGVICGFNGLTSGKQYYVSVDGSGKIFSEDDADSATDFYKQYVGTALSSTTLVADIDATLAAIGSPPTV